MKDAVINQAYLYLNDIDISEDEHGDILLFQYSEIEGEDDAICISKEKCREVALAISPELESELEKQKELYKGLKEYGDERIKRLESELKEAVELIELYIEKSTHRENGMIYINDFELFEKFNAFITKHKKNLN